MIEIFGTAASASSADYQQPEIKNKKNINKRSMTFLRRFELLETIPKRTYPPPPPPHPGFFGGSFLVEAGFPPQSPQLLLIVRNQLRKWGGDSAAPILIV